MSSNVITLNKITKLDIPPDRILKSAIGELKSVIISGYTHDGELWASSSVADGSHALWLVEKFKQMLMEISLEDNE